MRYLLLFLTCTQILSASCGTWKMSTTHSPCSAFNAIKLTYCPSKSINGMTQNIVITKSGVRLILNLHWCPHFQDPYDRYTPVTVQCDECSPVTFYAYRCYGDQKLIFSEEDTFEIVQQLKYGGPITLSFGMYCSTIDSTNFHLTWQRATNLMRQGLVLN